MTNVEQPKPLKFVAQIHNVHEVTLFGSADLPYWRERLAQEELYPTVVDGAARLLLSATQLKFMGVRFREFIFGISVSRDARGEREDGLFLLQAFNTFGPFAWVERACFKTPYVRGDVQVDVDLPATMRAMSKGTGSVKARMADTWAAHELPESGFITWQGPIYLPKSKPSATGKYFVARLEGETRLFTFDQDDSLSLTPASKSSVMHAFVESAFKPLQWSIQASAFHAKAQTLDRDRPMKVIVSPASSSKTQTIQEQ